MMHRGPNGAMLDVACVNTSRHRTYTITFPGPGTGAFSLLTHVRCWPSHLVGSGGA